VPGATTIVLTAHADATLYDRGSLLAANGAGEFIFAGSTNGSEARRALVRFDVAGALPAGATIASARLVLNVDRTKATVEPASVHRVTASWTEGTAHATQSGQGSGTAPDTGDATWIHRSSPDVEWATPGGDFTAQASARSNTDAPPRGQLLAVTWGSTDTMIADVQAWLADDATNYGWIVIGNESTRQTASRFRAREHEDAESRPALVIEYLP
jgi:hypothetical protein